ncbi:DMT family transporter [Candidatus Poribacteria bacterium]
MTSFALILVLISALGHSAWNYLTKASNHKIVFLWMMLIASGVIYGIPFCYRLWTHPNPLPVEGWPYVLATCAIHSLYFSFLGTAYRKGDLSTVYPVARGTAPVLVTFLAPILLGQGERPSTLGGAGIALVVIGIQVVGLPGVSRSSLRRFWQDLSRGPVGFAFLTGLMTTFYTLVDRRGVYHVDPFVYVYLQMVVTAFFLMPWMVLRKREEIKYEWTVNKWRAAAVGLLCVGAYGIILWVMTLPVKISYITAGRECSILFSSLLGIIALNEPRALQKVIGAAVIVSGILCITFAQ